MKVSVETVLRDAPTHTTITIRERTREQADVRFGEISRSVEGEENVKIYTGRRRIAIGEGLVISVETVHE